MSGTLRDLTRSLKAGTPPKPEAEEAKPSMDGYTATYEDRRKLQNRLAQRRYRSKLRQGQEPALAYDASSSPAHTGSNGSNGTQEHNEAMFLDYLDTLDHNMDGQSNCEITDTGPNLSYHMYNNSGGGVAPEEQPDLAHLYAAPGQQQSAAFQTGLQAMRATCVAETQSYRGPLAEPVATRAEECLSIRRRPHAEVMVAPGSGGPTRVCRTEERPGHGVAGTTMYQARLHDKASSAFWELEKLYRYSVDVGLLRADPEFVQGMRSMQDRFRALMTVDCEGGHGN
ncbi:uncharacterized protein B0I36DRAFT_312290 [Microdochium trichocladiopsis]|uniref:BZIP domain-containing protein n=1 Tax=Microdochium trichocladiopsis TaxID=1682393 RepID=A0A9P9BX34_9PEZI|nr:uncharacterized protein B0I36DRAFT_312290 [Microdochium trichocladiopsis]KAH7041175.1 hypothetical protein B0I36DRAFT_312290 [Microdochium trichocladiopsis]